jgi:type II secretory pathway pseudopilin PulG
MVSFFKGFLKMIDKKARSFVTIMIVVGLSALLLRTVIQKFVIYNIERNQSLALVNLKLFYTALENYAKDNKGVYPDNINQLTKGKPAYLEKDYLAVDSLRGYEYECQRLEPTGYNCSAAPISCNLTGNKVYTMSTGGLIIAEDCDKK